MAKGVGSAVGGAAGTAFEPFKHGGPVKGKIGAAKKAITHGGECVLPHGVKPVVPARFKMAQLPARQLVGSNSRFAPWFCDAC